MLVFGSEASQDDTKILEWVYRNNLHLLKASKLKQEGKGKEELVALLIKNVDEVELGEVGNPSVRR